MSITKEEIANANITYCKKLDILKKLLQLCADFLKTTKYPLVQDLLLFKTYSPKQLSNIVSKVFKIS